MSWGDLVFWIIAAVVFGPWIFLLNRYARANRRWYVLLARSEGSRVRAFFLLLRGGPGLMFRQDTMGDPETEAARQEVAASFRSSERYFIGVMSVALLLILTVAIVIAIHAIVT